MSKGHRRMPPNLGFVRGVCHYHAGHMPDVVRRGEKTAAEIYRRPAS